MTRLAFYHDDAYIYGLTDPDGHVDATAEFTDEEAARIRAADTEWWAVQDLVHARIAGASAPDTTPRDDAEPPGILLNRDEVRTARACIVFREVMGRDPGTTPVIELAARLDACLQATP